MILCDCLFFFDIDVAIENIGAGTIKIEVIRQKNLIFFIRKNPLNVVSFKSLISFWDLNEEID